jgi:hypothetical protein
MRDINVWAYHTDFGQLCRNARLDKPSGLSYPAGNDQGQADWHVAVPFDNPADLAKKLAAGLPMPKEFCGKWYNDCDPIARGEVVRLAICAHGDQGGKVAISGKRNPPFLTADNVSTYHADLNTIGLYTRESGSTIVLAGCLAGQGTEGTRLLSELSRVWPGRQVVGFTTVGYRHPGMMKRPGEPCELPGMRDTDAHDYLMANPPKWDKQWSDFAALPWASDVSIHAKVVLNGRVTRCPPDELCSEPPPAKPAVPAPPVQRQRGPGPNRRSKH